MNWKMTPLLLLASLTAQANGIEKTFLCKKINCRPVEYGVTIAEDYCKVLSTLEVVTTLQKKPDNEGGNFTGTIAIYGNDPKGVIRWPSDYYVDNNGNIQTWMTGNGGAHVWVAADGKTAKLHEDISGPISYFDMDLRCTEK
ncbi:MAG: hypothetical protein ACXVCG_04350 [Bdellovibrionota bacterium]